MMEYERMVESIDQVNGAGKKAALATVVNVRGSAYRRAGAKMLINEDGGRIGTISGGCLEPDVAEVAMDVMRTGQAMLKTYHLDEALVWGLGLGCPGTVTILIEPIAGQRSELSVNFATASPEQAWWTYVRNKERCVLATLLPAKGVTFGESLSATPLLTNSLIRLFISHDNLNIGDLGHEELHSHVRLIAKKKLLERNPKSEITLPTLSNGQAQVVFVDLYTPPTRLIIFGAGHDAIPVAKYAVSLGFNTMIVDSRKEFNNKERFLGTNTLILSPSQLRDEIEIDAFTYMIVMNHHLEKDLAILKHIIGSQAPYIGVLGPLSRFERMLKSLKEDTRLHHIHSPIGLDIGAQSPEEIAISILAEIIAIKNGHKGGFLQGSYTIH